MIAQQLKRRAHRFIWPSLGVCLLFYFTYHLLQGERGVLSWVRMEGEVQKSQEDLTVLEAEHGRLENRVKYLRDDSLSLELLEEEAKKQGFANPQEVVTQKALSPNTSPAS